MYYIFINEIKRNLKRPVIWIAILLITLLLYINIDRSYQANETDTILNYDPAIRPINEETYVTDRYKLSRFENSYDEYSNYYPGYVSPSYYQATLDSYELFREAYYDNDIKEKERVKSFEHLLAANHFANTDTGSDNHLSKHIAEIANEELWDKVSGEINYEEIDFSNYYTHDISVTRSRYYTIMNTFHARYHHYLSEHNLEHIESDSYIEFNNLYVINKWIKEIIPILLIILPILLNYDLINKDIREGSTKLLLTQSVSRRKYYLGKFLAGSLVVLFALIIPFLTSNLLLKTQAPSRPINYPIVYDQQGVRRFKPAFNYIEENYETYNKYEQVAFYKVPYSKADTSLHLTLPLYQRNTDLIGFDTFMGLTLFYSLLFILFMVALVQFLSTLINNVYLSLFATGAVSGTMYFLFQLYLYGEHYNLNPFTMNNGARIVAGTNNVTMLTAFIILSLSIIILLTIGMQYFKKKSL